jgi:hypothetical protein
MAWLMMDRRMGVLVKLTGHKNLAEPAKSLMDCGNSLAEVSNEIDTNRVDGAR